MGSPADGAALLQGGRRDVARPRLLERADREQPAGHEVVTVVRRPQCAPTGLRRPAERAARQHLEDVSRLRDDDDAQIHPSSARMNPSWSSRLIT